MTKKEFLEKYELWGKDIVDKKEFVNDVWSLYYEDRPQNPLERFMNKWIKRVYNIDHFEEFGKDTFDLVAWAKEEGKKEQMAELKIYFDRGVDFRKPVK